MLTSLDVPIQTPELYVSLNVILERRYRVWQQRNQAAILPAIRDLQHEILISGIYDSTSKFIKAACWKACQDVHLAVGMNRVPQSLIDEEGEYAWKYLRDQPAELVAHKLVAYKQFLTLPFLSEGLMSTSEIRSIGRKLEARRFQLVDIGYVDNAFILPAIGSPPAALSNALDGTKKVYLHLSNLRRPMKIYGSFVQNISTYFDVQIA